MTFSHKSNIKYAIFAFALLCAGFAWMFIDYSSASGPVGDVAKPLEFSKIPSLDGRFEAFIRREEGLLGHVWLVNLNTKQQFQLTKEPQPFVGLTFTPDGQSLTFLSRQAQSDIVATFDINFDRGLASVHYNQLSFNPGQLIAMPMWLDEDKLAYISQAHDKTVSLMQWSSSRGKHTLVRTYDKNLYSWSINQLDDTSANTL